MRIWLISENVKIVSIQLLRKCGFGMVFASVLRNVPYLRLFRSHCSIGDTSRTLQNTAHKTVYRLAVAGDRLCMPDNDHLSYPLRLLSFGMQMEYRTLGNGFTEVTYMSQAAQRLRVSRLFSRPGASSGAKRRSSGASGLVQPPWQVNGAPSYSQAA